MANYTGGGGGGAAVVPASFVVASDREDYPLTQAGLVAAIADLPAGGGDIYIGQGTLAITGPIALSKNLTIRGAGEGVTILSVTGAISMFTAGNIELTMSDFSVVGDNTAGQTFLTLTADALATKYTILSNIRIGTNTGFTPDGVRTFINAAGFARSWMIDNITLFIVTTGEFLANGATGTMRIANVVAGGLLSGANLTVEAVNFTITSNGNISFASQSKFTNCRINTAGTLAFGTETVCSTSFLIANTLTVGASSVVSDSILQTTTTTFGNTCHMSSSTVTGALTFGNTCTWAGGSSSGAVVTGTSCNISGVTMASTLTAGANSTFSACTVTSTAAPAAACLFAGCTIGGAVTASGAGVKMLGCTLVSFSSTSLDNHVLEGNSFSGGGNNVTLASSSSCQVLGNRGAQVVESGSSDSNTFSSISSSSTLIGASSVVTDAQKFVFTSPGTLTTTDNALFARIPVQVTQGVRLLSVEVETAPTGAALLVAFRIGTRSTGVLAAAFATVTVAIGAFTGSTTVAGITVGPTQFLVCEITQVGSTIPGSNMTAVARA